LIDRWAENASPLGGTGALEQAQQALALASSRAPAQVALGAPRRGEALVSRTALSSSRARAPRTPSARSEWSSNAGGEEHGGSSAGFQRRQHLEAVHLRASARRRNHEVGAHSRGRRRHRLAPVRPPRRGCRPPESSGEQHAPDPRGHSGRPRSTIRVLMRALLTYGGRGILDGASVPHAQDSTASLMDRRPAVGRAALRRAPHVGSARRRAFPAGAHAGAVRRRT
jgi:hypothetical protein